MESTSVRPATLILFFCFLLIGRDGSTQEFSSFLNKRWEFGLSWANVIPARKNQFSHVLDNNNAYVLLANESVGDEVGEGFKPPPLPGNSTVAGTLKPLNEVGVDIYYHWTPWIATGLEGGYGMRRSVFVDNRGIYNSTNFLSLTYDANVWHVNAPVKVGEWFGRIRPHALLGPGIYIFQERVRIAFNDSDDPQLKPMYVVWNNLPLFGIDTGAGFDFKVTEVGLISFELQYHKVFAPGSRFDFILPRISFSAVFP